MVFVCLTASLTACDEKGNLKTPNVDSVTQTNMTGKNDVVVGNNEEFKKPEEVWKYFVKAVADLDYDHAMSVFSSVLEAEKCDFAAVMENVPSWTYVYGVPSSNEENIRLNIYKNNNDAREKINQFILAFFTPNDYLGSSGKSIEENFAKLDVESIKSLKAVALNELNNSNYLSEESKMNRAESASRYGADMLEYYYAEYELNGQDYMGEVYFLRYEDNYYIMSLGSMSRVQSKEEWQAMQNQ